MNVNEMTQSVEIIYEGKILTLKKKTVLLPNQKTAFREIIEHPGGVGIVALDKDQNVLFVEQYRSPYEGTVLEIPAGKLEKGEEPLSAAARELLEETGFTAAKYCSLGKMYPSPGYTNEIIHLFLAWNLSQSVQSPDEDEFLNLVRIPIKEAVVMVEKGEILDAKTIIGLYKTYHLLLAKKALSLSGNKQ
jgi:ADP-ribose pyrophosphatase